MPSFYDTIKYACEKFLLWSCMLIVARVLNTGNLISCYTSYQVALFPEWCQYFTLDHTTWSFKFRDCVIIPFCKVHCRVPKASKGTVYFSCCIPVDVSVCLRGQLSLQRIQKSLLMRDDMNKRSGWLSRCISFSPSCPNWAEELSCKWN